MIVDGNRFRRRRIQAFLALAKSLGPRKVRVLDVGGTISYWRSMEDIWSGIDFEFTIVNLDSTHSNDGVFNSFSANAISMPEFDDRSFDLVHSNSVIEHVGHWDEMTQMAREIQRIGKGYFVQTPAYEFPVEPHFRTIGYHWLPEHVRARILMGRRLGFRGPEPSFDAAMRNIQSVNLVSRSQMAELFPDATLVSERVYGIVKSHIAIRRPD